MVMKAKVEAFGEGATSLIAADSYRFVSDEPPSLGGKGMGPNPLSLLLGSLVGCTQFTASMIANELKLGGGVDAVSWAASGEYNLQGVRGTEEGVDARFTRISLQGTVETGMSQQDLDQVARLVDKRCIIAATLKASGLDLQLQLKKGQVDHESEPARALRELQQQQGSSTGQVKGDPGRDGDAPRFAGTAGQGRASAHGFSTLSRSFHTSPSWHQGKDGEDVAREHLNAAETPQLQKDRSSSQSDSTEGSAYSNRDDPRAQASQPVDGKSDEQIVKEQGAGTTVHPGAAGNVEGGEPMKEGGSQAPGYADRAADSKDGESPLGDRPVGEE